ncbi:hypothetical protein GCM10009804_27910 [Kribbella hippodromi]|uniref:Aminoglycoside phosphotransferase domain-containing protein n=1 Tax=Kribbella hippodromi TaxID=434347 RepID=A0ABN2D7M2_9ACTN
MGEQREFLDHVTAIARRHGVDTAQVYEVPGGVANRAFVLGPNLFLRVSRPGFEQDLHKETQVVPIARLAGVHTPAIVDYDPTQQLIPTPYAVMQRVHGTEPRTTPTALAIQLARLHQVHPAPNPSPASPADGPTDQPAVATADGPTGAALGTARDAASELLPALTLPDPTSHVRVFIPDLPLDDWGDPHRTLDDLATRGYLDPGTANWLTAWFTRLANRFDRTGPKVLIHGDVATHNLLAAPDNSFRALIDWGDAAWAPPAMDFAKLPLPDVATLLPTYLHHTNHATGAISATSTPSTSATSNPPISATSTPPTSAGSTPSTSAAPSPPASAPRRTGPSIPEDELAAGILWLHLSWALSKLPADPWPNQRHWTAPPTSRLLGILRFFTGTPPEPWSTLR